MDTVYTMSYFAKSLKVSYGINTSLLQITLYLLSESNVEDYERITDDQIMNEVEV